MALGDHAVLHMAQHAFAIDDESRTHDAHAAHAILFLFLPHAVFFADLAVHIGQEIHRQTVLVAEGGMADAVVLADADDGRIQLGEFVLEIAEFDRFDGTAGRVVLGVEIQYDDTATQLGKLAHFHVGIRQGKVGCGGTGLQHGALASSRVRRILTHLYRAFAMRYHTQMKNNPLASRPETLLGGLDARQFLAEYWQKKPLLIRGALPGFDGLLSPEELAGLACEDGVESRLVLQQKTAWRLEQGPFDEDSFLHLPATGWTLLVQNVNHYLPEAAALLRQFDFIPHARLDDLMVSYAPDGGGVGPHFDSYDVFLLQGQGKRLWRISEQQDLRLDEDAPLRILKHFDTEQEWLLEPGDMLYLPPHLAHWGIAVGNAMTYSIGFRAPAAQELAIHFLGYMQERIQLSGVYADPGLTLQTHPAEIGPAMIEQAATLLQGVRWQAQDVARFLGGYLTEPKQHVVFDPPRGKSRTAFQQRLRQQGICLALQSQMLFQGDYCYINGEEAGMPSTCSDALRQLADTRALPPGEFADDALVTLLYQWYLAGYCLFPED